MQNHNSVMVCLINAFAASASRMSRCEKMVVSTTSAMVYHNTERPHSQATTMSVKVNQLSSPEVVDPILTNPAPYNVLRNNCPASQENRLLLPQILITLQIQSLYR